jgi:hypothetical protein
LPRLLGVFASPLTTLARVLGELQQLLSEFGPATPVVGGMCWLLLLWTSRRSAMMWTATALVTSTMLGGALTYFMEVRYVWLLGVACLAALPAALGLVWRAPPAERFSNTGGLQRWTTPSRGIGPPPQFAWPGVNAGLAPPLRSFLARAARLAALAIVGSALALAAVRISVDLVEGTRRLRRQQTGQRGVEKLLAPAAERATRAVTQGARPFSTPTVMSARAGQVLTTGCRWLPLPVIPMSSRTWADATPEQKDAWLRRMLAVMRRGNVRYVVLRGGEYHQPSLRPLFARARELPPELELVGDILEEGASGERAARVLRLKPQAPEPGVSGGLGESDVRGRLPSADQL